MTCVSNAECRGQAGLKQGSEPGEGAQPGGDTSGGTEVKRDILRQQEFGLPSALRRVEGDEMDLEDGGHLVTGPMRMAGLFLGTRGSGHRP